MFPTENVVLEKLKSTYNQNITNINILKIYYWLSCSVKKISTKHFLLIKISKNIKNVIILKRQIFKKFVKLLKLSRNKSYYSA